MHGTTPDPSPSAPGSRLLPPDQRGALRSAPVTSWSWRALVLGRGWLNRHRHRWLGPALVCAPPVGVAMLWAGASRPGHRRRWVTVGAAAWTLVLVLAVVLLTVPGAQPAEAGSVPSLAGGPALQASPTAPRTPVDAAAVASSAAEVRAAPADAGGLGSASVARSGRAAASRTPVASAPRGSPGPEVPASDAPQATPTPTPRRTPAPTRTATPEPPVATTANPFTSCSTEGATAVSPHGWSLRCSRTPIGLYWLYGR